MLSMVETYLQLMMVDFIAHLVCYNVIGYETLRECMVNETFTDYQHQ